MGRKFNATGGQSIVASGTETALVFTAPSTMLVQITRVRVSQRTHTTSEQYKITGQRASAAGSGGGSVTPAKRENGGPAAGSTVSSGPTTEPTYTANTKNLEANWNSLVGRDIVFPPGEGPVIPPSGIYGIFIECPAGTTTFTPDVEVEFEEIG